jgi:hypothetical protein
MGNAQVFQLKQHCGPFDDGKLHAFATWLWIGRCHWKPDRDERPASFAVQLSTDRTVRFEFQRFPTDGMSDGKEFWLFCAFVEAGSTIEGYSIDLVEHDLKSAELLLTISNEKLRSYASRTSA